MTFRFRPEFPVDRGGRRWGLQTRIGLVLTGLAACLLLIAGGLWLHATRVSVHEEVEAATRVAEQWLRAVDGQLQTQPGCVRRLNAGLAARLEELLKSLVPEVTNHGATVNSLLTLVKTDTSEFL